MWCSVFNVLQVSCSVLQCVAACCTVLQRVDVTLLQVWRRPISCIKETYTYIKRDQYIYQKGAEYRFVSGVEKKYIICERDLCFRFGVHKSLSWNTGLFHGDFLCGWHYSFICATWLIHMCDMTHSYVRHDSFIFAAWRKRFMHIFPEHLHSKEQSHIKCVLQHSATHTATHCNTLQHTATHCNTLPNIATHCTTLQHTATNYNALQHIATLKIAT